MADYYEYLSTINPSLAEELRKGLTKPNGIAEKSESPPSMKGAPAAGNTAGPGRPKASPSATTLKQDSGEAKTISKVPKATNSTQELVYLPKKDFPQAPKGTVGSTENSWKVPAGIGRQLQAQQQDAQGNQAQSPELKNKSPKSREVITSHLKEGVIASKKRLDGDNASHTFKIQIQGNGSGIMKPQVESLKYKDVTVSKEKPKETGWNYDQEHDRWIKEEVKDYDLYAPDASGSFGAGNIIPRTNAQREVAAHNVFTLHGLDNVPITVIRKEQGKEHSVQAWKDNHVDMTTLRQQDKLDPEVRYQNDFEVLKNLVPKAKHKELEETLMDMAVSDVVINNNDRHGTNFLVDPETGSVQLIDHGFAFCNGVHGVRNHFLHNTFHGNKPIKMSDRCMTRLSNLGLRDYQRAMPGMSSWEVGQTFLRNRYVTWLQKNHGSIDRQKFLHTMNNNRGTLGYPGDANNWSFCGDSLRDHMREYGSREQEGVLPNQLFEKWAKAYIDQVKADPKHRDYHDITEIDRIGVFMEPGFPLHQGGVDGYRKAGKHKEYEKTIQGTFDIPASVGQHMQMRRAQYAMRELDQDADISKESATRAGNTDEISTKLDKRQ